MAKKGGVDQASLFRVQRTWEAVQKGIKKAVVDGVEESAQKILDRAIELAPRETNALIASGKLINKKATVLAQGRAGGGSGSQVSITIEFVGELAGRIPIHSSKNLVNGRVNYAAAVHELHPTNAHFLLQAEHELANDMKETIREKTSNVIRKNTKSFRSKK